MCLLCNYGGRNIHDSSGLNYIGSDSLRDIVETSDAPYSLSTGYTISAGDTFSGNISYSGDKDAIAIRLIRGASYTFELTGRSSGHGTLYDPYLELFDFKGSLLSYNDDGRGGLESRISFSASNTGTYYFGAKSSPYFSNYTGSYRLSTTVSSTPEIVSTARDYGDFAPNANLSSSDIWSGIDINNAYMQGLKWGNGCKWGSANPTTTTTALKFFIYDDEITMGQLRAGRLLAQERTGYISAMNAFSSVANITFSEGRTASESHILWASLNNEESQGFGGWASPPDSTGSDLNSYSTPTGLTTVNHTEYSTNGSPHRSDIYSPGTYLLELAMHELGHSMGLAHPHDNSAVFPGVSSSNDTGDNGLNAAPYTVMSYNSVGSNNYNPSSYWASSGFLETLGAFDIAATQALYGANTNAFTGNNTYSLDNSTLNGWNCLWDNGGEDTITAAGQTDSVTIDLRNATLENSVGGGGFVSRLGSQNIGYTIAFNSTGSCIIENANGGSNNDTLIGNEYDNNLLGEAGHDNLTGGSGNDTLDGGLGDDTLIGGAGDDTYVVDSTSDTVTENSSEGTDLIQSSVTYTASNNIENLTLTGSDNIDATGNSLDNTLTGNSGNNTLDGGSGDDTLDGGTGNDTLIGGTGDDTYVVDSTSDTITENSSEGTDLIQSSVTYTASNNVENLTLTGSGNINATGNSLDNTLTGNTGNNTLNGGSGNDTLIEGNGDDILIGGNGNDTAQFSLDIYNYTVWKGTNLIVTDKTSNRGGEDQLSSIETVSFNGTSIDIANLRTGMYVHSNNYQLLGDDGAVTFHTGWNDDTSSLWDVVAAKNNSSSFEVLFDGTGSSDGQVLVWTTNSSGAYVSESGWLTDAQATAAGYENTFIKDFNNDGLISGGDYYQLLGDDGAVTFHTGWNDDTSSLWDVVAAKNNSSSFEVLFDGTGSSDGQVLVWTMNSSGAYVSESGWLTDAQATAAGYESIFNMDLNNNGSIGS